MKMIVAGGTLMALLATSALAQTSSTEPEQKLPPGFANVPDTKWAGDLPPGLSNERAQRDWETTTPPGWTNPNSQGWQSGGGPSSVGAGPSSPGAGKGRGR